jgi:phosphoribosylformylglycinamidine (FGAM) synthase PurS component
LRMWTVEVRPKGRDRKGEHLQRQIAEDLGIAVRAVQTSEVYYIDGGNVKKKIVAGILHDMLVQEAGEPRDSDAWMVEVRYKPSVTDPAEHSPALPYRGVRKERC